MRGSDASISSISFPFVLHPSVLLITAPPTTPQPVFITAPPAARPATPPPTLDYAENCLNKYCRFAFNSKEVAYVLLRTYQDRPAQAIQYPPPVIIENTASAKAPSDFLKYTVVPTVNYLPKNLYAYGRPNGTLAIAGETNQQMMRSVRTYYFQIQEGDNEPIDYAFHPSSPTTPGAFIGHDMPVKIFKDTEEAQRLIEQKGGKQKTGEVELIKDDILIRDVTPRNPDQKTVMGKVRAVEEMANTVKKYGRMMTQDAEVLMQASADAPFNAKREGQIRTEWGHGNSYRHTPMDENPQRTDNLAAMRKCDNTAMMILEGVAKCFKLNMPDAKVKTNFKFDMLLDTNMTTHIYLRVMITIHQFKIKLTQSINTPTKYPAFAKTSDLAGLIHILFSMINHIPPRFTQPIDVLIHEKPIERPLVTFFSGKRQSEECCDDEPAGKKQKLEMS